MPKELPEVNKLLNQAEKRLRETLSEIPHLNSYIGADLLSILGESIHEAVALGKKETLEGIKNGTICSSCGEPMEQGLSDWCGECWENN